MLFAVFGFLGLLCVLVVLCVFVVVDVVCCYLLWSVLLYVSCFCSACFSVVVGVGCLLFEMFFNIELSGFSLCSV